MKIHAIVPVKALHRAKSRLTGTLAPDERRALAVEMLQRVLATLRNPAAGLAAVWLISVDPTALRLATVWGARPVRELTSDLNGALEQARAVALAAGAEAILVVPGDLPLITPADLAAIGALLTDDAEVVLATDAAGSGTNALGLRQSADLPFRFGHGSAALHQAAAEARGLTLRRYASATLALDIDGPDSLALYRLLDPGEAAWAVG